MADAPPPGHDETPEASLARRLQEKYGHLLDHEFSISLDDAAALSSAGGSAEPHASSTVPPTAPASPLLPSDLDRYTIGGEIARGGMGAVLEVWDRDLARTLAMKVLLERAAGGTAGGSPSAHAVQRFIREARITGQLDHPGIVPVHELGVDDDGRVFFTMRLLRGHDLSQVFEKARTGTDGWNRTRALEVFLKICDTMAYAHSRHVVHRDLKPLNVIVGDFGEVSVLDWGLAKRIGDSSLGDAPLGDDGTALDEDPLATMAGTVLGTPSFMAPEQAHGHGADADPRLDVYSLGAMLYTLLAGRPPYIDPSQPASSRALIEAVRTGPPPPLQTLAADLPVGLVAIQERAMARDRADRYADAAAVAAALRDHLEQERLAAEETKHLRGQLEDAQGVSKFLAGLFRVETVADASKPVSIVEILERGDTAITEELADQPAMRASVHAALGDVHNSIGLYGKAVPHFEEAVRLAREHAASAGVDLTLAHRITGLAQVLYETGEYDRAEPLMQEAIELLRTLGIGGEPLARAISGLCSLCWNTGRMQEALPLARESLAIRREVGDEERLAISLVETGVTVDSLGDFEEAEQLYHEALEIRRRVLGPRHAMIATIHINIGALHCYREDFHGAVAQYEEALSIREEALGPKHPKLMLALLNLGYALGRIGEYERAEKIQRDCLAMRYEVLGAEHPTIALSSEKLALVLIESAEPGSPKLDEAEELLETARAVVARGGDQNLMHSWIESTTAKLREKQGRLDEARAAIERAIEKDLADGEELHAHSVDHMHDLGRFLLRHDMPAEAIEPLTRCLEVYERQFRPHDPIRVSCAASLAEARERAEGT